MKINHNEMGWKIIHLMTKPKKWRLCAVEPQISLVVPPGRYREGADPWTYFRNSSCGRGSPFWPHTFLRCGVLRCHALTFICFFKGPVAQPVASPIADPEVVIECDPSPPPPFVNSHHELHCIFLRSLKLSSVTSESILMLIKGRPPQFTTFVENKYRHEHAMITNV